MPEVIKICDMIMGGGKTSAAVTYMNSHRDRRFIFITPYLSEVERVREGCVERHFTEPINKGKGKLDDLHYLLEHDYSLVSTHALFRQYNAETLRLIRDGGYTLIMDESFQSTEPIPVSPHDMSMLRKQGFIEVEENGRTKWLVDEYEGKFSDLRELCRHGEVTMCGDRLFFWNFPVEVFRAFDEVILLTYLFPAQVLSYYFKLNGVPVEYIGTDFSDGEYFFSKTPKQPEEARHYIEKIHILDDGKLNRIGSDYYALSSTWYSRAQKDNPQKLATLRNNITNVFRHRFDAAAGDCLWTTFKAYSGALKGKGYASGFLSCNTRATNEYRERRNLAYCVNIFFNPFLKNYFLERGIRVEEERFALSEMIQWVWRSAIRNGEDIWIYVPSQRMRELLHGWLTEIAAA